MERNSTFLEILGKRVRFLRKQKGLSILDLSIEAGINRNYLCDLEKGRRNPTVLILNQICGALNISLSYLFEGIDVIV
ncbi:MAG: helix-turn-helix domain-containing protein [Coprobacillus sp.]|nr:helix-turn-helix domain-containing protein [Coprobacillus sp.]